VSYILLFETAAPGFYQHIAQFAYRSRAAAMSQETAATFSPSAKDAAATSSEQKPSLPSLLARATDLRERMTALVSIAAMAPKKSKRSRKPQTTEDTQAV
jgi:hypothetical protein